MNCRRWCISNKKLFILFIFWLTVHYTHYSVMHSRWPKPQFYVSPPRAFPVSGIAPDISVASFSASSTCLYLPHSGNGVYLGGCPVKVSGVLGGMVPVVQGFSGLRSVGSGSLCFSRKCQASNLSVLDSSVSYGGTQCLHHGLAQVAVPLSVPTSVISAHSQLCLVLETYNGWMLLVSPFLEAQLWGIQLLWWYPFKWPLSPFCLHGSNLSWLGRSFHLHAWSISLSSIGRGCQVVWSLFSLIQKQLN